MQGIVIAGTHSGCGKTTITLGLLAALIKKEYKVQPFKAGPDFIDPGLHALATGRVSRNLDLWMCGEDYVREILSGHSSNADASMIEGVMGYFDGGERSTAALAKVTGAKVVLVVDAYGMAESVAAIVEGFKNFSSGDGAPVDAVIFNRVGSMRHFMRLKDAVSHIDMEVLGHLPREAEFHIPERHLGLMVAEESPLSERALGSLASTVSEHMDMARVAELASVGGHEPLFNKKDTVPFKKNDTVTIEKRDIKIAVARDRAFTFYYEDNLDVLKRAGAEIVEFSPLDDDELPEGVDGVYLGGGYPEMFSHELNANSSMRKSVCDWAERGGPLYAECGGLMYLGRNILIDGDKREMCGALPIETELMRKRSALGYREVTTSQGLILGPLGTSIRGHEFHYSRIASHQDTDDVSYNVLGEDTDTVTSVSYKNTLASYTHLHWGGRPDVAGAIVDFICRNKI
ncbi:MAG: cobyrinate a,c-diamide synthase [Thermodesulfovibrionales bacterium]|nr:cobyrinate a,c-diamide synthase [Thermodesulfovibrionales bacterium]